MKPDGRFVSENLEFWAHVRLISEQVGYTVRKEKVIKVPTLSEMKKALERRKLGVGHLVSGSTPTEFGRKMLDYFQYRADALNTLAEPNLMNTEEARILFGDLRASTSPTCKLPMNKQKGDKKTHAFFTGIVNMLIEANAGGLDCDYDPMKLTTITRDGGPLRTLARRVDGAFPSTVNPIAVWEIKEYYYTKTFGSRVADGIYETLLDGMELEELRTTEDINVLHYLMVDAHYTWWECGRSYLCRIVDMLHMGYVDEVLFGNEVVERLPSIVKEWVAIAKARGLA